MKTKTINTLTIHELDEETQIELYQKWVHNECFPWHHDYEKTLESFCNEFYTFKITNWQVSDYDYNFKFVITDYDQENMVFDRKVLIGFKNKLNDKKFNLTGFCADNSIILPLDKISIDELKSMNDDDIFELLHDCIDSFFCDWKDHIQYTLSFKNFLELCDGNEYLENGTLV